MKGHRTSQSNVGVCPFLCQRKNRYRLNKNTQHTASQQQIAEIARSLRETEAAEKRAQEEATAFFDQMAWNATVTSIKEQYGIDPTLISPRGKSRWTNRGLFEGPISIVGLKVETRAVLTEVDDDERILGYRTVKKIALVRPGLFGKDKPVSRLEIATHLEKVAAKRAQ